jgi:hypothetical protein
MNISNEKIWNYYKKQPTIYLPTGDEFREISLTKSDCDNIDSGDNIDNEDNIDTKFH